MREIGLRQKWQKGECQVRSRLSIYPLTMEEREACVAKIAKSHGAQTQEARLGTRPKGGPPNRVQKPPRGTGHRKNQRIPNLRGESFHARRRRDVGDNKTSKTGDSGSCIGGARGRFATKDRHQSTHRRGGRLERLSRRAHVSWLMSKRNHTIISTAATGENRGTHFAVWKSMSWQEHVLDQRRA